MTARGCRSSSSGSFASFSPAAAAGDLLVPSGKEDGTAQPAPEGYDGPVVGRALEASEGDHVHRVETLVGHRAEGGSGSRTAKLEAENEELRERVSTLEAGMVEREERMARLERTIAALASD